MPIDLFEDNFDSINEKESLNNFGKSIVESSISFKFILLSELLILSDFDFSAKRDFGFL